MMKGDERMTDLMKSLSEELKEEIIATRPDGIWFVLAHEHAEEATADECRRLQLPWPD
jgi:hypothetical protein